jgi:hypothetical protein
MKRFKVSGLLVAMVLAFVLTACAPMAGVLQAVQIPPELESLLRLGVEIVVVWGLTQLSKWGLEFSGYKVQIVAAIFGAVIAITNAFLGKVPLSLEGLVGALLNLLVVVLSSYGVAQLVHQYRNRKK